MNNKNYKEFFALNSFLILAMLVFGTLGFGFLGAVCASAVVCACMLKNDALGIVVSIALAFVTDSMVNISFSYAGGLVIVFCAFCVNWALREKRGLLYTVAYGVLGMFAAFAIVLAIGELSGSGIRVADIKELTGQMQNLVFENMKNTGFDELYSENQLSRLVDIAFMSMIPAFVISASCVYSYLTVAIIKKIEKKLGNDICSHLADFTQIKADKMCMAVMIVSFLAYMFTAEEHIVICAAMFCMFFLIAAFYMVCGISVIVSFAKKMSGVKKGAAYVFCVLITLVFTPTVIIIGIVDSFANIRKIAERR